jgi:N,N-dimethylformamidase
MAKLTTDTSATEVSPAGGVYQRCLIGYASELSLRPRDSLEFMVSALKGDSYKADLVRVINGDALSRYGDQFEILGVESSFAGEYQGRCQPLNLGSFAHIDNAAALDGLDSFTVAGWIYPCFNPAAYEPPDLDNIDPFSPPSLDIAESIGDQVIIARYDNTTGIGWSLQIDKNFHLVFVLGHENLRQEVQIGEPLRAWDWAYVAATYDAQMGSVSVYLREKPWAPGDRLTARNLTATAEVQTPVHSGPLRIAALRDGPGAPSADLEKPGSVFNGRIQDLRIANRVLGADELDLLSSELTPGTLKSNIIADWDFSREMQSNLIRDISGNGLDGILVNAPDRAVRGVYWDGSTVRWTDNPDLYDAITFHADDLYDAEWSSDFSFAVPEDFPSGIYAARLTQDNFVEYVTFFVAAPAGQPRADLALWLSDFNYMAYSNISIAATAAKQFPGHNFNQDDIEFFKANREYATGGVYNMHLDGLYYSWGSRKRPDLHMKPGAMVYNFVQDTHITAFLEHEGITFDIITDELVAREGIELLSQYRCVISSTHHEYVTTEQFDAIDEYTANGGRFIYVGGNGWFWSVDSLPAYPGTMESRNFHEIGERHLVSGQPGGLMVETGRRSGPVFGNEMSAMVFNGSSPYRKIEDADNPRATWIFEGTGEGEVFGDYGVDRVHGGAAGFEIDRYVADNGVPRHALHLATSEPLRKTIENVQLSNLPLAISYDPSPNENWGQADLVFFETPDGGAMFSTGSINWISSTLENGFNNDVAQITRNVVRRFLDPAPFPPVGGADVHDVDRSVVKAEHEHADRI